MRRLADHLLATLNGNPHAFNEVVRRYQEHAQRRAYGRLGNHWIAQEVVQEAFLAAYLNLSSLRTMDCFPAWFQSILSSCISRSIKQNDLNVIFTDLDQVKDLVADTPSESGLCDEYEASALVRRAIRKLSRKERDLCTSFYLDGYSHKQMAELFDLPLGTVKRRLHEVRRKVMDFVRLDHSQNVIRVGFMPISDHLLAMVSHQANDESDMRIDLQKFISWTSMVSSIKSGHLDAAFIMATLGLSLKSEGVPISYVLDAAHGGSAITVRDSIQSVRDLSGARMGLPLANSTHHWLLRFLLDQEAVSFRQDISATYLSPSYSFGAFKKGQIDSFFCAEPWNTKAVCEGIGRTLIRSQQLMPGHICCILVVRNEFVQRRSELLRRYLKGLLAAGELVRKSPEKASRIQEQYTGIDTGIAQAVIKNGYVTFSDLLPDKARITKTMNMALSAGTLKKRCNLNEFILRTD